MLKIKAVSVITFVKTRWFAVLSTFNCDFITKSNANSIKTRGAFINKAGIHTSPRYFISQYKDAIRMTNMEMAKM